MSSPSSSSSSSSSSSPMATRSWRYDVFLSFRGDDTRNNFVDHLYSALVQNGIYVFKDDMMLQLGKPISLELRQAIEESKFAVVIISKNYANSSWCLDELFKIIECKDQTGQEVLPVFYHVDPSDVCGQKINFETAFEQHEEEFKGEMEKVKNWKKALTATANLRGLHISSESGGESEPIKEIVREILRNIQPSHRDNNLIGIESRVDALNSLLSIDASHEVRMIGIFGMGGIGKTTIAQTLFRKIAYKFEGSSFINNVRENSSTNKEICLLQEKILEDLKVVTQGLTIQDPEYGADMIHDRLRNKRVLLILDDVDDFNQLEYLAATQEWFGLGSRIIITTRDEHVLAGVSYKYKPALLLVDQALELFSRHAFRKNRPPDEFKDLSNHAISFTDRLPLALKVLGSFFHGIDNPHVWESALARLAKTQDTKITSTLKFSFDHLDVLEKKIFLDIACFFKGKGEQDVIDKLDSFDFDPIIGIDVLIEKSLITIAYGKIEMHDLIQEMAQKIVCQSCPSSRLWRHDEIHDIIKKNEELKSIEAIVETNQDKNHDFNSDVFQGMKNLRLLNVYHNFTSCEPTVFPDELRWLSWFQYPFPSLPLANLRKLVGLELHYGSMIRHLWEGQKVMPNLKYIRFNDLPFLVSFPDISEAPNIEILVLLYCTNLEKVHGSVGSHKRLVSLEIRNCSKLKFFPSRLEMESLKSLDLINCHCLESSPEFSPCMSKLSHIDLYGCDGIKELSSSIKHISNLEFLNLEKCTSLKHIPNSIYELKNLTRLCLHDCRELQKLPDEFGSMDKLYELQLGSNDYFSSWEGHIETINFHVLTKLYSLRILDLNCRQIGEEDFPEDLHGLSSLEELILSRNSKLTQLPTSITHLSRLKHLELDECTRLQNLNELPPRVQVLMASHCSSLEQIKDLSNEHEYLYRIWLLDCQKLLPNQENKRYLDMMSNENCLKKWAVADHGFTIAIPGSKIPSWFKDQHGNEVAINLQPNWQSQIAGFAICGVFKQPTIYAYHYIEIRYETNAIRDFKLLGEYNNAPTTSDNENVWIGYIPFSCFVKMRNNNYHQYDDWSNIIEGNLMVTVGLSYHKAVRCGAHVVYKKDVESIQQRNPNISSYYWNWELVYNSRDTILCK